MFLFLFILSIFTTNLSIASANELERRQAARTLCEPVALAVCCPILQTALTGSSRTLLPIIPALGENSISATDPLDCALATAVCLAPYAGRFSAKCIAGEPICEDPLETCCPGISEGKYAQSIGLACKGPLFAACLLLDIKLLEYEPQLGRVCELLPNLFGCEKDAAIVCAGCQMLTAASYASHFTADFCNDCYAHDWSKEKRV